MKRNSIFYLLLFLVGQSGSVLQSDPIDLREVFKGLASNPYVVCTTAATLYAALDVGISRFQTPSIVTSITDVVMVDEEDKDKHDDTPIDFSTVDLNTVDFNNPKIRQQFILHCAQVGAQSAQAVTIKYTDEGGDHEEVLSPVDIATRLFALQQRVEAMKPAGHDEEDKSLTRDDVAQVVAAQLTPFVQRLDKLESHPHVEEGVDFSQNVAHLESMKAEIDFRAKTEDVAKALAGMATKEEVGLLNEQVSPLIAQLQEYSARLGVLEAAAATKKGGGIKVFGRSNSTKSGATGGATGVDEGDK